MTPCLGSTSPCKVQSTKNRTVTEMLRCQMWAHGLSGGTDTRTTMPSHDDAQRAVSNSCTEQQRADGVGAAPNPVESIVVLARRAPNTNIAPEQQREQ